MNNPNAPDHVLAAEDVNDEDEYYGNPVDEDEDKKKNEEKNDEKKEEKEINPDDEAAVRNALELERRKKQKRREGGARLLAIDVKRAPRQYIFDSPDPQFYLGAALIIGCASLFTFLYDFIAKYGRINNKLVPIITFCGGFALALPLLIYYSVTSKHYAVWGRLWDGIAGSFPIMVGLWGVIFVYVVGIYAIYYATVDSNDFYQKFLVYATIPLYLLVFLPLCLFGMSLQAKSAENYRIRNGIPLIDKTKPRYFTSGFMYIGVMLRRFIVAWVLGVCVAAHYSLPAYALGWCAYGLYKLGTEKGYWLIAVVLAPPIILFIALCIIPQTRIVGYIALWIVIMYFYYPLNNWNPRDGSSFVIYDNSLTYERRVFLHNRSIKKAEKFYVEGNDPQSENYYREAEVVKNQLILQDVCIMELDHKSKKPVAWYGAAPEPPSTGRHESSRHDSPPISPKDKNNDKDEKPAEIVMPTEHEEANGNEYSSPNNDAVPEADEVHDDDYYAYYGIANPNKKSSS